MEKPDVKQSHTTSPVPPAKSAQEEASYSLLVNLNYWPLELLFDNVVQVIYSSATPSSRHMSTAVHWPITSSTLPTVHQPITGSTPPAIHWPITGSDLPANVHDSSGNLSAAVRSRFGTASVIQHLRSDSAPADPLIFQTVGRELT